MRLSAHEIALYTGGDLRVSPIEDRRICTGLSWDSRAVALGDLFLALQGNRVDGHVFVANALRSGAHCALVCEEPTCDQLSAAAETGSAIVVVADTLAALSLMAQAWRRRLSGTVVALTGSSGKTTTKDLLFGVLRRQGSAVATAENQNNELGAPATLLRAQEGTRFTVVEMGMRGAGQLAQLCAFTCPDMALVTNVGTSHIELLGSQENIARAKAEPFLALRSGGVAFMNASDEYVESLREFGNTGRGDIEEVFFDGSGVDPATYPPDRCPCVFASDIVLDRFGKASFLLHTPTGCARCDLQMRGLHNVHNAVSAAAVGWKAGMEVSTIAAALQECEASSGRQQVFVGSQGATIVDDSYNANPDSMRASLSMFAAMDVSGRRIAVLGDMAELGSFSHEGHASMGRLVASLPIQSLVCVGDAARGIAEAALDAGMPRESVFCVDGAQAALLQLEGGVVSGDAVLVKASHAMALDRVVEGLIGTHV